jgi:Na+/phosphate symporter
MVEKEIAGKMILVSQILLRTLELAYQGFRTLDQELFAEAENAVEEARMHMSELTRLLISKCVSSEKEQERECIKRFLPLSSCYGRMTYNMDGIMDRLRKMVREGIPFSDRGSREISEIFGATIQILKSLPDLILTQNELLVEHNEERAKTLFKTANACAEEHEMRLIEGLCAPKASPIYLGFMESLKAIASHSLEIGKKIISLPSHSW